MIDWQQIDTVFLDMDGTLLDLHFDNYFWLDHLPQSVADKQGISKADAMAQLSEHFEANRGTLNWYCLDYWSDLTHMDIVGLKQQIQDKISFRPHVPDFLEALHSAGKRTVIITNAHPDSVNLKLTHTGLDKQVDRMISSHEFKAPKEEQTFWQALQDTEPFDPARTLFIDDSLDVLNAAAEYGIQHLLSIYQPDSQQPKRTITDFSAIDHFDEIMPLSDQSDLGREAP